MTATICLTFAVLLGSAGESFAEPICNKVSEDPTIGEFSQECIQSVLENLVLEMPDGFFVFSFSSEENIYVQGIKSDKNEYLVELSSQYYIANPNILDKSKVKKLIELGWNIPEDSNSNYYYLVSVKEIFKENVSKNLYESLKVFGLPQNKIDVRYRISSL